MNSYKEVKDTITLTTNSVNVSQGSFIQLRVRSKRNTPIRITCDSVEYQIPSGTVTPKFDGVTIVYKDATESEVFIERSTYTLDGKVDNDESFVTTKTNLLTGMIEKLLAGSAEISATSVVTFSELKAALTLGFIGAAFVSDVAGGSIWVSDGTSVKPLGGSVDIYSSPATVAFNTSQTRSVGIAIPLPVGLMKNGDVFEVELFTSKSGATDTANVFLAIGVDAVTVGTQLGGTVAALNYIAATRRNFGVFRFRRDSATSIVLLNGASGNDGTTSTTAVSGVTSTVPDVDAAIRYLQVTNAMGASAVDVVTIEKAIVRLRSR